MKTIKLGGIATIEVSGVDKKIKEGEFKIRLCNFVDVYYNWAITKNHYNSFMIATARLNEVSKFQLRKGQVALTKDSETRFDIGVPTYIADDFDDVILGYHCALITPNANALDGRYLNALLHTDYAKKYFACNASGSGQRYALSVEALNAFPVPAISLQEQKRIGDIFSALDKKIALNRAINHNLEALAKQLYDYWFVQFDFPNEEGKPYKSSGGEMIFIEKLNREIPKGWNVVSLADILCSYTEKIKPHEVNAETNYAPIEVIPRRKMSFNECAPVENAVSGLCRFYKSDILLSNRRVYFHKVSIAPFDGVTRDTVIVLKPVSDNNLGYSYEVVNDDMFIEYATRHSYGTEQPVLSWESAKFYNVIKPSNDLDLVFSKKVQPMIDQVLNNEVEISHLMKQRNELLPLIMNGQVSVMQLNYDLSHG